MAGTHASTLSVSAIVQRPVFVIAPVPRESADRLYRGMRFLIGLAMRIFFRKIAIQGGEHIREQGPVILAANHPSGLIDAFSLGLATRRKVHFTARSTLFRTRPLAALLSRFGVIPLYRRLDAAEEVERNVEVFAHCSTLLAHGGVIGIFPEGVTHVDPQVKEMRTGAVRLGLEAESRHDFRLDVWIVPVGINFGRPGAWRSSLTLRVGPPLRLAEHAAPYRSDPAGTVQRLTSELRAGIEALVVHLEDLSKAPIVEASFEILGPAWVADRSILPEVEDEATRQAVIKQRVADAVEYYARYQPAWATGLERRLAAYRASLQRLRLTDEMLQRRAGAVPLLKETLPVALVGVLGAPFALFGWLINVLPQLVTGWLARRFAANPTQLAAWKMWIGLQAFTLVYGLFVLGLHLWAQLSPAALLVALLLLPVTGWLSSEYFKLLRHYLESVWLTALQLLRRGRLQQLHIARARLSRDGALMRTFFA